MTFQADVFVVWYTAFFRISCCTFTTFFIQTTRFVFLCCFPVKKHSKNRIHDVDDLESTHGDHDFWLEFRATESKLKANVRLHCKQLQN